MSEIPYFKKIPDSGVIITVINNIIYGYSCSGPISGHRKTGAI